MRYPPEIISKQLTAGQEDASHIWTVLQIPVFSYLCFPVSILTHNHLFPFPPAQVQGNFALEIPVEFSMVPMAKMLIYTILPDGEVIADSVKFQVEKCLRNKVRDLLPKVSI